MVEKDFYKQDTLPAFGEAEEPQEAPLPEKIGPYKVEALIEKGGMSYLYLGTHPDTGDTITIKVLSPKYLSHPEMVQRFLNEAEIIALADHPNIVKLYGHGEWEGGLYIAMEYIQGTTLRDLLTQQPMSLKRALEAVLEIAYAICHLHTHGVIHRDLKPENVLVTSQGQYKVIDFGIAQLLTDEAAMSQEKRLIGTPVYMSPEQRQNPSSVSYPSDIYSLGIIAYELILGRLSHGEVHLSLMPKGLQKIFSKALQPNPKDRYQDIVDFITDISNYLNSTKLQQERGSADTLSELSEHLGHAQTLLLPKHPPAWPKVEIGVINHRGVSISGVYYDFFDISGGCYGIILSEPSAKGVEGVMYSAVLRGMVRTLSRLTQKPGELVTILNELLSNDPIDQIFTLSYLILDPVANQLRFISCGYGNLWYIPTGVNEPRKIAADNIALGIDGDAQFLEVNQSWNVGDTLLMNTFATIGSAEDKDTGFSEQDFRKAIMENLYKAPQKQVETIFRKALTSAKKALENRSISLISIQRKD